MRGPTYRIRRPRGDSIFVAVAIAVTSLWVLIGLLPSAWIALSAFKSTWETTIFPPTIFPSMPRLITVAIAYDSGAVPAAPADIVSLVRDDAITAEWAVYDNNPRQPIGELQVQAFLDGNLVYQSSLMSGVFKYGRDRVWATTLLNRRQILRHKGEIMDGDSAAPYYEQKLKVFEPGKGPPIPPAVFSKSKIAADIRDTLDTVGLSGTVHAVTMVNAPEHLLDNFGIAWNSAGKAAGPLKWGRYFFNSGIISLGYVLGQWLFSACAAFALSRLLPRRASKYVTMFFLATMMIPGVAMVLPLYLQMLSWHLLNTYWAIILPAIPSGFFIYIFKGFFNELPGDLFDAARIDGASEYQAFGRVAIPLSGSVFAVVTLMVFVGSWNSGGSLMWSSLVLQKEAMFPFPLEMRQVAAGFANPFMFLLNVQTAMILLAAVPTLIMFAFFQNRVAKGMVWAGIKG